MHTYLFVELNVGSKDNRHHVSVVRNSFVLEVASSALEMVSEQVVTSSASTICGGGRERALNMRCYNQRHDTVLAVKTDSAMN